MNEFSRDNHFVPMMSLKRWAFDNETVWLYRLLVSHSNVPEWKRQSIRGIAYQQNLYTRLVAGDETDEFERWLNTEFETPAEEALRKATSNQYLSPKDWGSLIRFAASQDVRTPAGYIEYKKRCGVYMPKLLKDVLEGAKDKLEDARRQGRTPQIAAGDSIEEIPLAVTTVPSDESGKASVMARIIVGRQSWLSSIRYLLKKTAEVLLTHRWMILAPPQSMDWFTSDNPFIRLNYYRPGVYDFRGGWGNKGTELILPLSPRHLLYTKVGDRLHIPRELPENTATLFRQIIAEHAHRHIIAASPDVAVSTFRPRIVDAKAFEQEKASWNQWHKRQTEAENNLRTDNG